MSTVFEKFDPKIIEKWRNLPEYKTGEVINNELFVTHILNPRNAYLLTQLVRLLNFSTKNKKNNDWLILHGTELYFENNILVQDIAGFLREKSPKLLEEKNLTTIPVWCCEIVTDESEFLDLKIKVPLYAKVGIEYLWTFDTRKKILQAFKNESNIWKLIGTYSENDNVKVEPFTDVVFTINEIWN